jgi:hypothetical protein
MCSGSGGAPTNMKSIAEWDKDASFSFMNLQALAKNNENRATGETEVEM